MSRGGWKKPVSAEDVAEMLSVCADLMREHGEERRADLCDYLARTREPGPGVGPTGDDILRANGLDPARYPGGVTGARRSGRTTRMLAEAAAALARGYTVDVRGHRQHEGALEHQLCDLLRGAGLGRLGTEWLVHRRRPRYHRPTEAITFWDHYVLEQEATEREADFNKAGKP